jgi:hypothetical protein
MEYLEGEVLAERFRTITSRDELRALLEAFEKLDLVAVYAEIQTPTLVEHHPAYFFPDLLLAAYRIDDPRLSDGGLFGGRRRVHRRPGNCGCVLEGRMTRLGGRRPSDRSTACVSR